MAKKLSRKDLLNSPDEFMTFSDRAVAFVKDHARQFELVGIALAVLCVVYLGISWYMGYMDKKGQEAYNKAFHAMRQAEAGVEKAQDPKAPVELFQEVVRENGMSKVSDLALPQLAYLKFQEGDIDEAIGLYREFLEEIPEGSIYGSMARLALVSCYEAKKDYEKAIEELQPMVRTDDAFLREQALVALVRMHTLSGNPEEAEKALESLEKGYPDSAFLQLSENLVH